MEQKELIQQFRIQAKEKNLAKIKDLVLIQCQNYLEKENSVNNKFIVDSGNEQAIDLIISYFFRLDEFEKFGGTFDKGLLLKGNPGVGKDMMMDVMASIFSFQVTDVDHLDRIYMIKGIEALDAYGELRNNLIHIQDIGNENEKTYHYQQPLNTVDWVIRGSYKIFLSKGIKIHISSNLDDKQRKQMYGERLNSRMDQMFNHIIFKGNDRRVVN